MQVNDAMVRAASEAMKQRRRDEIERGRERATYEQMASLALTAAMAELWRPIGEAEPNRTYLLGWHDWRDHAWCTEVAPAIHGQRFENGYSNVSRHGSATHFMPLPTPPRGE